MPQRKLRRQLPTSKHVPFWFVNLELENSQKENAKGGR